MRLLSVSVFLAITMTSVLALPLGANINLNGIDARDYDDGLVFEAREHHGGGTTINIHLRDLFGDELDERDYFEDVDALEARYDKDIEEREFNDLGQDFEVREEYLDLETREPLHLHIGTVILPLWNNNNN